MLGVSSGSAGEFPETAGRDSGIVVMFLKKDADESTPTVYHTTFLGIRGVTRIRGCRGSRFESALSKLGGGTRLFNARVTMKKDAFHLQQLNRSGV